MARGLAARQFGHPDCGKSPVAPTTKPAPRAQITSTSIELGIGKALLEERMDWIIEVMPSDETASTSVAGDFYHILSESSEIRFRAGHLSSEAFKCVVWDIAVACPAISVKFNDLESAQHAVLEALTFRVGSATPGTIMVELCDALPMLRLLVVFDGRWDAEVCADAAVHNTARDVLSVLLEFCMSTVDDASYAFLPPIPAGREKEVLSGTGAFKRVPPSGAKPADIFTPLLVALNRSTKLRSRAPGLVFENASINATEPHTPGFMKPHICCYTRENLANVRDAPPSSRAELGYAELFIEVKADAALDFFVDPPPQATPEHCDSHDFFAQFQNEEIKRRTERAFRQHVAYAMEIQARQHRVHLFSISIAGSCVRLLRWDRSGIIITKSFDILTHPDLLCDFLSRFAFASDYARGHDGSVAIASPQEELLFRDVVTKHVQDQLDIAGDDLARAVTEHYQQGDISIGNIILVKEPGRDTRRGYLIDWETSSRMDPQGCSLDTSRTGTWKFMSAKILSGPTEPHTFADDMESLLWVVHYCSLLYLPHNLTPEGTQSLIRELYDKSVFLRGHMRGGFSKIANRVDRRMTRHIVFTNPDLQKWLDDVMDLHGPKGLFDEAAERLWKDPENLDTLWREFLATHTLARDDRIENEFPDPDTYHDRPEGSHVTFVPRPPPALPAKRLVDSGGVQADESMHTVSARVSGIVVTVRIKAAHFECFRADWRDVGGAVPAPLWRGENCELGAPTLSASRTAQLLNTSLVQRRWDVRSAA
ncbi:hypothetical protein VTO73DRAFT_9973 [Trametes versicolor]